MICGMCGAAGMLNYEIVEDAEGTHVHIRCANCASLTEIGEVLETKEQYEIRQHRLEHGVIS